MKMKKAIISALIFTVVMTSVLSFGGVGAFAAASVTVTDKYGSVATSSDGDQAVYQIKSGTGGTANATSALRSAFAFTKEYSTKANPLTISITGGAYDITSNIVLSSFTTINLDGVTLYNTRNGKGNIFIAPNSGVDDDESTSYFGYDSLTDFTMNGGILDYDAKNQYGSCLMRLAHSQNISINKTTFKNNYYSHHIEIAACKNISFNGCTFEGQKSDYSKSSSEALQIDILEKSTHFSNFMYYDGTMSTGVTVENCTFKDLVAGVGTRSAFAGLYQNNIVIKNNYFENISASAIVCTNYTNTQITGNTIVNCGEGISYYMNKETGELCYYHNAAGSLVAGRNTNCKSEITNNNISVAGTKDISAARGIYIYGESNSGSNYPKGNYAVYNLKVSGNTVKSTGYGIDAADVQECDISGNAISNAKSSYYGIRLRRASAGNSVTSNSISGFDNAVCLDSGSDNNNVLSNIISSTRSSGITVLGASNSNTLAYNSISATSNNGIYVGSSSNENILNNTVASSKGYGIQLSSSSGIITGNSVAYSGKSGITLTSSTAPTLAANTVNGANGNGIYLNKSSATTLTSNSVSGCTQHGINVSTSSNAYNVSYNGVSQSGQSGVRVYNSTVFTLSDNTLKLTGNSAVKVEKSSDVTYVNGNSISSSYYNGIEFYNACKAKEVKGNSISKSANNGIAVSTNSNANVKANSISSSGGNGIYVTNVSVSSVSSNTVKSSGKTGVYISNKATATVKSNKISSSKSNGIYVGSQKATVYSNTLSSNAGYGAYFNSGATVSYKSNTYSKNKKGNAYSKGKKSYKFSNISKPKTPSLSKSKTKITVRWRGVSGANCYYIYRATSKNGTYSKISTAKSSSRSYTDKSSKKKGKTYYYKVVAVRKINKVTVQSSMSSYKSKKI